MPPTRAQTLSQNSSFHDDRVNNSVNNRDTSTKSTFIAQMSPGPGSGVWCSVVVICLFLVLANQMQTEKITSRHEIARLEAALLRQADQWQTKFQLQCDKITDLQREMAILRTQTRLFDQFNSKNQIDQLETKVNRLLDQHDSSQFEARDGSNVQL